MLILIRLQATQRRPRRYSSQRQKQYKRTERNATTRVEHTHNMYIINSSASFISGFASQQQAALTSDNVGTS